MDAGKLTRPPAADTAGAPATLAHAASGAAAGAAPEWIELLPAGVFNGRDGRGPFKVEDPPAVIAATRALAMAAGIPIDYDHATDFGAPAGRPAPAAGWIVAFEVRSGAVWGRVEWTTRAAHAIAAREYRYVSPVFQFDPASGRVTRLLRAGLTNNPNLYLTAIAAAATRAANPERSIMDDLLEKLKEILGLDPGATLDQVLAAVQALAIDRAAAAGLDADGDGEGASQANARALDPARYVAVAEFQKALTELNAMRAERARERAANAVDEALRAGKLVPAQREWAIAYCAADPAGFNSFVARQPAILGGATGFGGEPPAAQGAAGARAQLGAAELAICAQLGVSAGDFVRRKHGRGDFLSLITAGEDR
ncbi:MAG TPA: phage protease [Candidatus Binataceae bacterium]|nr:phage protease [Candidatus Binataceae bacterium]